MEFCLTDHIFIWSDFYLIRFLSDQNFVWLDFCLIRFLSDQILIWSDFYLIRDFSEYIFISSNCILIKNCLQRNSCQSHLIQIIFISESYIINWSKKLTFPPTPSWQSTLLEVQSDMRRLLPASLSLHSSIRQKDSNQKIDFRLGRRASVSYKCNIVFKVCIGNPNFHFTKI